MDVQKQVDDFVTKKKLSFQLASKQLNPDGATANVQDDDENPGSVDEDEAPVSPSLVAKETVKNSPISPTGTGDDFLTIVPKPTLLSKEKAKKRLQAFGQLKYNAHLTAKKQKLSHSLPEKTNESNAGTSVDIHNAPNPKTATRRASRFTPVDVARETIEEIEKCKQNEESLLIGVKIEHEKAKVLKRMEQKRQLRSASKCGERVSTPEEPEEGERLDSRMSHRSFELNDNFSRHSHDGNSMERYSRGRQQHETRSAPHRLHGMDRGTLIDRGTWSDYEDDFADYPENNKMGTDLLDMRKMLLFHSICNNFRPFTYQKVDGSLTTISEQYLRFTVKGKPQVVYSANPNHLNGSYFQRNELLAIIPKPQKQCLMALIEQAEEAKPTAPHRPPTTRSWYPKDFLTERGPSPLADSNRILKETEKSKQESDIKLSKDETETNDSVKPSKRKRDKAKSKLKSKKVKKEKAKVKAKKRDKRRKEKRHKESRKKQHRRDKQHERDGSLSSKHSEGDPHKKKHKRSESHKSDTNSINSLDDKHINHTSHRLRENYEEGHEEKKKHVKDKEVKDDVETSRYRSKSPRTETKKEFTKVAKTKEREKLEEQQDESNTPPIQFSSPAVPIVIKTETSTKSTSKTHSKTAENTTNSKPAIKQEIKAPEKSVVIKPMQTKASVKQLPPLDALQTSKLNKPESRKSYSSKKATISSIPLPSGPPLPTCLPPMQSAKIYKLGKDGNKIIANDSTESSTHNANTSTLTLAPGIDMVDISYSSITSASDSEHPTEKLQTKPSEIYSPTLRSSSASSLNSTPDTNDYKSHWESEEEQNLSQTSSKFNNSWESEDEYPVIVERVIEKPKELTERSLEMPLNINISRPRTQIVLSQETPQIKPVLFEDLDGIESNPSWDDDKNITFEVKPQIDVANDNTLPFIDKPNLEDEYIQFISSVTVNTVPANAVADTQKIGYSSSSTSGTSTSSSSASSSDEADAGTGKPKDETTVKAQAVENQHLESISVPVEEPTPLTPLETTNTTDSPVCKVDSTSSPAIIQVENLKEEIRREDMTPRKALAAIVLVKKSPLLGCNLFKDEDSDTDEPKPPESTPVVGAKSSVVEKSATHKHAAVKELPEEARRPTPDRKRDTSPRRSRRSTPVRRYSPRRDRRRLSRSPKRDDSPRRSPKRESPRRSISSRDTDREKERDKEIRKNSPIRAPSPRRRSPRSNTSRDASPRHRSPKHNDLPRHREYDRERERERDRERDRDRHREDRYRDRIDRKYRDSPPRYRDSPSRYSPRRRSPPRHRYSPKRERDRERERDRSPRYRERERSPRRRSLSPLPPRRVYSRSRSKERKHESITQALHRLAGMDYEPCKPSPTTLHSPMDGYMRGVADSTISDEQLMQNPGAPVSCQTAAEFTHSPVYFTQNYKLNNETSSPKRIPLDDRINQVLGIDAPKQDYPVGAHTAPPTQYYNQMYYEQYGINVPTVAVNEQYDAHTLTNCKPYNRLIDLNNVSKVVQVGNVLQVVPTEQQHHKKKKERVEAETPQKFVPVGNMLQIVPTAELPTDSTTLTAIDLVGDSSKKKIADELLQRQNAERKAERDRRRLDRERRRTEKELKRKEREKRRQLKMKLRSEEMIKKALLLDVHDECMEYEADKLPVVSIVSSASKILKGILVVRDTDEKELEPGAQRAKKGVRFADGVLPGEGTSPSGGEELSSPPLRSRITKEKRYTKTKKPKRSKLHKKKIKVKIIRKSKKKDDSDMLDNLPPPSPPPGSPPSHIYPPRVKSIFNPAYYSNYQFNAVNCRPIPESPLHPHHTQFAGLPVPGIAYPVAQHLAPHPPMVVPAMHAHQAFPHIQPQATRLTLPPQPPLALVLQKSHSKPLDKSL